MRSAVILAGGQSTRFGADKSLIPVGNRPTIRYVMDNVSGVVDEVVVVARDVEQGKRICSAIGEVNLAYDPIIGYGPVAGILAGLRSARAEYVITLACDMPLVNPDIINLLFSLAKGYDAVVPKWPDGNLEPLHAVYKRSRMAKACEKAIELGERIILAPLRALPRIRYVSTEELREIDLDLRTFINVNTPDDLEAIRLLLQNSE
ncbi:MAG: molybdenum cofactor guanylyltransferase [Methanocellales archaeon]|nr:molybdenum cofactor guanylyltransferase [Methanocellales archaeon]